MIIYNLRFYHYFVNFQENGDKNGDIEDITWPRGDTKFLFES